MSLLRITQRSIFFPKNTFPVHENTNAVSRDYKSFENMAAHAIFCSSRRKGVQGIPFNAFFASLLGGFQEKTWERINVRYEGAIINASALFVGYGGSDLTNLLTKNIPFLAPPNAEWPSFILELTRNERKRHFVESDRQIIEHESKHPYCKFGHLIRAPNTERCDVYVQDVDNADEKAIFLCECKYLEKNVGMSALRRIIHGLDEQWEWDFAFIFCLKMAKSQTQWVDKSIGCVKISSHDGSAEWIFQPEDGNRKKLLVVVETTRSATSSRKSRRSTRRA